VQNKHSASPSIMSSPDVSFWNSFSISNSLDGFCIPTLPFFEDLKEAPWSGALGELLHRGPWKIGFLRDIQGALWAVLPLIGALLGNLEWVRLPGPLREKKRYLGSFFLDPEDIRKLT
jgi:hypothetical protein